MSCIVDQDQKGLEMKKKLLPLAAASVLASVDASAQTNTYLDLKPAGIDGEATSENFKGQVDVLSWGWGLSNSADVGGLSGGGAVGKTTFQPLSVEKNVDSASSGIYQLLAKGGVVKEVTLTTTRPGGAMGEQAFTTVKMGNVVLVGAQQGSSNGDDRPTESISMIFSKFCFTQNMQNEKGEIVAGTPFCWDIVKNESTGQF